MPAFPRKKAEVMALAQAMKAGFAANPTIFTTAVYAPADFDDVITGAEANAADRQAKETAFRLAVAAEADSYDLLETVMRRLLATAEAQLRGTPNQLGLIGWGPPAPPQAKIPGQPRALESSLMNNNGASVGPGSVFLDWKTPGPNSAAGKVAYYRVERCVRNAGTGATTEDWGLWSASAIDSETTLTGQPRGSEIDYRIIAVNPNGDSLPSNSVTVVL